MKIKLKTIYANEKAIYPIGVIADLPANEAIDIADKGYGVLIETATVKPPEMAVKVKQEKPKAKTKSKKVKK